MADHPLIAIPPMCEQHTSHLVHQVMHFKHRDPWRAAIVTAQILLFQAATADQRLHQRSEGDANNLSLILAEFGPLCCALRDGVVQKVWRVMKKGLTHAASVSRRTVVDPDFDITAMSHTLRNGAKGL